MTQSRWEKIYDEHDEIDWKNRITEEYIQILGGGSITWKTKQWIVTSSKDSFELQRFKSKSEAISFANKYMRTH